MRVGDLQQIMLQTDTVGKVQQQGAYGAEIEQSKLAAQQLFENREKAKQIQSLEESDTVSIKDRDSSREQQAQSDKEEEQAEAESENESGPEADPLSGSTGRHIDIRV
ncbi:MAG: hypothetical protein JXR80_05600 [Deltaproteobacteria bacterium]|nr:hypothetical protein [Deltaproteobacteria bacterium]